MDLEKYTWHKVGSSYTCAGIPGFIPKDIDWLAFIPPKEFDAVKTELLKQGYKIDGNYPEDDGWISLKKNLPFSTVIMNKIISKDYLWVQRFLKANELCKKLQLVEKDKRIILHEEIING